MLALIVVVLTVHHAHWWWTHQYGFPLHLDDGQFLATSLWLFDELAEGLPGVFRAFRAVPLVQGPLVPLLTMPAHLLLGPGMVGGVATILGFYVLLIVATYAVARRLLPESWALLSAVVVATSPGVIGLARSYVFAVPSAALFMVGVLFLARSEALERTGWVFAGCIALGLATLSRTMMLGLIPGPLLAIIVQSWGRGSLRRGARVLIAALVMAAGLGWLWFDRSLQVVLSYLRGSIYYRPPQGGSSLSSYFSLGAVTHLSLLSLLVAGALGGAGVLLVRLRRRRESVPTPWRRRVPASEAAYVGLIVLWNIAVLALANTARGEWLPALPLVTIIVMVAARVMRPHLRVAFAAALIVVSVVHVVMFADVWPWLARPRSIGRGATDAPALTDGRSVLERYIVTHGGIASDRPGRVDEAYRGSLVVVDELVTWVRKFTEERGEHPVVALGPENDALVHVGNVNVSDAFARRQLPTKVEFLWLTSADAMEGYRMLLGRTRPDRPNVLVVTVPSIRDGVRRYQALRDVARGEGFTVVRAIALPDGRSADVLWRPRGAG